MKYVKVKFLEGNNIYKEYAYKTVLDLELDDLVVVHARDSFRLAKVSDNSIFEAKGSKYVICKVDLKEHEDRKDKEEKAYKIKQLLETKKEQLEEDAIRELLASKNDSVKALLKELKELEG